MMWCLWCGERIKWTRSKSQDIGQWVHQDEKLDDDHFARPTRDQERAQLVAAERRSEAR